MLRKHKFNASRKRYGGTLYHSKKEADYAARLDLLKKAADPKERVKKWERQVKVPLLVRSLDIYPNREGAHVWAPQFICNWYIDFLVTFGDGRIEYHEVKGFPTEEYRLKRKLFLALYPERTLKIIT